MRVSQAMRRRWRDLVSEDLRVKMELHPKSILWQVRLGVNVFSAERVAAAKLEVHKKVQRSRLA